MSFGPGFPNRNAFDGFLNEFFHIPTIVWAAIWAVVIELSLTHIRRYHKTYIPISWKFHGEKMKTLSPSMAINETLWG